MRVQCPNCGGDHPKWDCKRPAKKSVSTGIGIASGHVSPKAESEARVGSGRSQPNKSTAPSESKSRRSRSANESLPVDTNSSIVENEGLILSTSKTDVADTSAGTVLDKDRQPKFDKVAYQRNYMRTYRAKKKEAEK